MYSSHTDSGFSLVEALVAISLLLLMIVGPMELMTKANHSTAYATEQVIAWFLAQEGLELAQKGRDDLLLDSKFIDALTSGGSGDVANPWADFTKTTSGGIFKDCFTAVGCGLSLPAANGTLNIKSCASNGCRLYIDDSTPLRAVYVHNTSADNEESLFTRVITMEKEGTGGVKVTSTVTWRTGSLISSQKVESVTYLYNVYDTP